MSRRSGHNLIELARMPWWASVVLAATTFVALRWAAPELAGSRPVLMPLAQVAAQLAPWLMLVFLLPVPFSVLAAQRRRRLVSMRPSLERLRTLSWRDFEQLVAEYYRRRGYRVRVIERGGAGADGGIDLQMHAGGNTIVVQCKRWQARAVGVALVRELYGAMTGDQADAALFITTGQYTPDAIDFAVTSPSNLSCRRTPKPASAEQSRAKAAAASRPTASPQAEIGQ